MKTERTDELYKVLLTKGYPKELCAEIAYKNLNTDYTATRMLGYLYRYTEPRLEDVMRFSFTLIIMEKKPLLSRRRKKRGLNISGQKILRILRKKSLK